MHLYLYHLDNVENPIEVRDRLMKKSGKVSMFDTDKIICENQIRVGVDRALRAEEQEKMIANTWGVELLLHMAGTHQIRDAIAILGITQDTTRITIVTDDEHFVLDNAEKGWPQITMTEDLKELYQLIGYTDPCREIIAKGVDVLINHQ